MFVVALSVLAVIGFVSVLIKNPSGMLTSILMFIAFGLIIWLVLSKFTAPSSQRNYKKAVKQSKKYQKSKVAGKVTPAKKGKVMDYSFGHTHNQTNKTHRRKKSDVHLTVIDGKKGKKKNQA